MNFSLTDGETVVCSRFCDKYPLEAPPSLYFCYGDAEQMKRELEEQENAEDEDDSAHDDSSSDDFDDEHDVSDAIEKDLSQQQSLPGKLLSEVDASSSAFIVASDPLTKSNAELKWHRVAANSIIVLHAWIHSEALPSQGWRSKETRRLCLLSCAISKFCSIELQ